ncbi:MAG: F0F1 ATP synthase subunit delta [Aquificaceae bacterium]
MKSVKLVIGAVSNLSDEELLKFEALLNALHLLYRKETELRNFLLSPFVEKSKKMEFLNELSSMAGLEKSVDRALELILELGLLPKLAEIRRSLLNRLKSTSSATLILAREQSPEIVENIRKKIEDITNRRYILKVSYDPELIGGFIFVSPNILIDASIKNSLEKVG